MSQRTTSKTSHAPPMNPIASLEMNWLEKLL